MTRLRQATVAALAAAMIWAWAGAAGAVETVTVAKTGDLAPGGGGAAFAGNQGFGAPAVNGAGEVAFFSLIFDGVSSGRGIWRGSPGGLALVARSDDPAPGAGAGVTFESFLDPVLNGTGEVAFGAFLNGGGQGIWRAGPAGLALVAMDGDPAPGAGGATFSFSNPFPALNGAGEVAFRAELSDGGEGIWLDGPAGLALVARDGDPAPGTGGETFTAFDFLPLNGAGEVAFRGDLSGGLRGIWRGGPAGLTLVALAGDPAPGTGSAIFSSSFFGVALNDAGEVAFSAPLTGVSGSGIWRSGPGGLTLVARNGDLAPGAGGANFGSFNFLFVFLNGAGEVAFDIDLDDGGHGIWRGGPDGLALVARDGDPAPGTTATFANVFFPAVNEAGEVAFKGELTPGGGVTTDNDFGIWAGAPGSLQLIAREGDEIEVAPGDSRTVTDIGLNTFTGNEDGQRSGFSEGGQVAFSARFTDATTQGIFLAPPKPPKVHLLAHRAVDSKWDTVFLPQDFTRPVVIAGPPSFDNRAPGVVRLRRVGATSFQARFQEWAYLDGKHPEERVDFLVMEKGRRTLQDGSVWEAGTLKVSGNAKWTSKSFRKAFPGTPKLFLTVQFFKDKAPVTVRARKVTKNGFQAALFEEEAALGGGHGRETVGYLAVFSGTNGGTVRGGVSGTAYELKRPGLTDAFKTVLGQQFKLEEEKSKDRERNHVSERASVLRFGRGHFAQQATDKERDTTAIRKRPVVPF